MNSTLERDIQLVTWRRKTNDLLDNSWKLRSASFRQSVVVLLCGLKKMKAFRHKRDRRQQRCPEWLYNGDAGLYRLVKLFQSVGTTELRWKYKNRQFDADGWLRTSREEVAQWLSCTIRQLECALPGLKRTGVLEVKRQWDAEKGITAWWIRLNPWKLEALMQEARDQQKVHAPVRKNKVAHAGKLVKENRPVFEGDPTNIYVGIYSTSKRGGITVQKDNIKTIDSESENSLPGQREASICLPATATTHPAPAFVEVSEETTRVITRLKTVFRHHQFTLPAMQQLDRLVTRLLPAQRLTEERAQQYAQVYLTGGYQDRWEMQVSQLDLFIKGWHKIRKALHTAVYANVAASAIYDIKEEADPKARVRQYVAAAQHYVDQVNIPVKSIQDRTPRERLLTAHAEQCAKYTPETTRWMGAVLMDVDPAEVFADRVELLRKDLHTHPDFYVAVRPFVPLQEWAGLSERESEHLLKQGALENWRTVCKASLVAAEDLK